MNNEDAIRHITTWLYVAPDLPPMQVAQAMELAVSALRAGGTDTNVPTMLGGQPLTLEQLRGMANKPYWHVGMREDSAPPHWSILDPLLAYHPEDYDYGECWVAYAYPPAQIDREAWEPCEYCNGKTTLYQHTNSAKLFMNTFGKAATLVTECIACPPYADCCMKDISANSAFRIKFCPECGRPLTEEAWAELEKRVRG